MEHSDAELGDRSKQSWLQLDKQAFRLYELGRYDEAIRMAIQACEWARQQLGADHPDYAASLGNLAVLYMRMSNYTTAEPLMRQALEINRRALGEDHPDYVNSLNNLAGLHYYMGNHVESAQLYQQAVNIERTIMGENHPDYIASLNNLAELYRAMGNYSAAEPLVRQALEIGRKALGEDHPDYAISLNNLAVLYRAMGKDAAAEPLVRQALEIKRKALGEDHPDYATDLDNLAVLYTVMRRFAEAEPLFRQALEIKHKALGENHPDNAISLNNLAELYRAMGKDAAAEPLYHRAISIWQVALGENDPNYAIGLNNLGRLYHDQRNYAAAEPLLRQALKIRGEVLGESHPDYIQGLDNLGRLYLDLRNYSAAEPLLRQAATSLTKLGNVYKDAGNYSVAEPLYRQALEVSRKGLGENHPDVALSLKNLADLYHIMRNYALAEPLYLEARDVLRQALGEEHPDYAKSLIDLANMYVDRYSDSSGDKLGLGYDVSSVEGSISIYPEALMAYQAALEILRRTLGEEHPDYALALDSMARLHTLVGHYATAEPLYSKALEIWRTALGENHPGYSTRLNNLGVLYLSLGSYAAAEPLLRQALENRRRTLGKEHSLYAISLANLAILAVATGHQDDGLRLLKAATKINDRLIGQVFSISSESHRMNYLKDLQVELNMFLSLAANHPSVAPEAVPTALELVLHRKALGAEVLAAQRNAVLSGRYPALEPVFRELSALRARIAQRTLAGPDRPGKKALRAYQQQLAEWSAQKEWLEAEFARQIPEMTLEQQFYTADWPAIASRLPAGAALVEFIRFREFDFLRNPRQKVTMTWDHKLQRYDESYRARYLAFVLEAGEPDKVQMLDLGAADSIDRTIVAFREAATDRERALTKEPDETRQAEDATRTAGAALRAAVFDPLLDALNGCKLLFLSPDGDLTQLPFQALPLDNGRSVIDDYQISYLSTGRDALRFRTIVTQSPQLPVILADPDFDLDAEGTDTRAGEQESYSLSPQSRDLDRSSLRFNRLRGARQEGEQVGHLLGVPPLLAQAALEGRLKSLRSPRILHIATHGFFLPDQPIDPFHPLEGLMGPERGGRLFGQHLENPLLRSGLALAGANSWLKGKTLRPEAEDGLLTAEDVTGLDLLDTELVVLSACDTGRGEVHVGEGVFGLRRAFVLAGAKTLVMSLWKVPDQATRELMVDFYQRLLAGQPRAEALRGAQRALKARPGYAQVRFWGAFICQGDPGPLS